MHILYDEHIGCWWNDFAGVLCFVISAVLLAVCHRQVQFLKF